MRYRLRTLLILAAVLPPLLAGAWWAAHGDNFRQLMDDARIAGDLILVAGLIVGLAYIGARLRGLRQAAERFVHCERHNLTMRMQLRRFTRLTNGFSRKLANHEAALRLYFAHYNFCQRHGTIKTTPAVAAGIADKPLTIAELIDRTADYNPPQRTGDWQKFLDILPD